MSRVFVGIGSNIGDRRAYLRAAVDALLDVVAVSPVYETVAIGGPGGQADYLNAVVELKTGVSPLELLKLAFDIEQRAGRERGERNGPRTLDVDILLIDDQQIDEPGLTVPHPRMWQRRFVLAPLADLAPELVMKEQLEAAIGDVRLTDSL